MDFDLNSLKQSAQNVGDDTLNGAGDSTREIPKNVTSDQQLGAGNVDHSPSKVIDLLEDDNDLKKSTGSSEDFEHVDPTSLTQTTDKVIKKISDTADDFNDLLGGTTKTQFDQYKTDFGNEFSQFGSNLDKTSGSNVDWMSNVGGKIDLTKDFMNAERRGFVEQPQKPQQPLSQQHPLESAEPASDTLIGNTVSQPQKVENKYYDDFAENESPASSYNPSPIKKNPVATALKEQENEKFISSEDLLGDLKEERTATPDLGQANSIPIAQNSPPVKEDFSEIEKKFFEAPVVKPDPIKKVQEKHSAVEEIKSVFSPSVPSPPAKELPKMEKKLSIGDSAKGPRIVSVEEIFCRYGLDAWFKPDRLHPIVESLIYWRDVKKSGIVLGIGTLLILALACCSVISVVAYVSLITLSGTIAFRVYKTVMQAIQKTSEGHPFKEFLAIDLELSQDKVQNIVSVAVAHLNGFTAELRRLFLVENLVDSLKFGVILWVMTYIGAWFNGLSIVFLTWVSVFTFPKVYENNKQSIDAYLDVVRSKWTEITDKVKVAIPIGKKPVESEKDK